MIVWTGFGFLIALIGVACLLGVQVVINSIMQDTTYYEIHAWVKTLAMFLAALFSWLFVYFVGQTKQRMLTDNETGQEVVLKASHTLFFIDTKYWPFIYLFIGAVVLFV